MKAVSLHMISHNLIKGGFAQYEIYSLSNELPIPIKGPLEFTWPLPATMINTCMTLTPLRIKTSQNINFANNITAFL